MKGIGIQVLSPILGFVKGFFLSSFAVVLIVIILFFGYFFIRYKYRPNADYLASLHIKFKPYDLLRWLLWDYLTRNDRLGTFDKFGFTLFVGRQGEGKTISMVKYLEDVRLKYPECIIVTNFDYEGSHHTMTDWRCLLEIRNGEKGVIFAIDEIHSEYSSASWKDFPETLLSEISQQRKQRIKIISSAQVFDRVVKPIREQTMSVVECETYLKRYTVNREYDIVDYDTGSSLHKVKKGIRPMWKSSFVQSNRIRSLYDTYAKVDRMKKLEFIPRNER